MSTDPEQMAGEINDLNAALSVLAFQCSRLTLRADMLERLVLVSKRYANVISDIGIRPAIATAAHTEWCRALAEAIVIVTTSLESELEAYEGLVKGKRPNE